MARSLLASATLLLVTKAYTSSEGPPEEVTGAPGELTCAQSGCHDSFELNSGTGSVTITGVPSQYEPGAAYDLVVTVAREEQVRGGFQLTAKKPDGTRAGDLPLITGAGTRYPRDFDPPITGPQYIEHRAARDGSSVSWNVQWIAPAAGSGTSTLYVAGNSANGDFDSTSDRIYTNSYAIPEAVTQVCLGDLDGSKQIDVADAIQVLRHAAGFFLPAESLPVADVNQDGEVNVADAVLILRVAVDLDTSIPKSCP